jgi:hypothetical protein
MSLRLAIIGPQRRHTGTGPFVAEYLRRSGCSVFNWNRAEASGALAPGSARPAVDAVAICSPAETHLDYMAEALAKGLHVFCEKPIVWPADQSCDTLRNLIKGLALVLDFAHRRRLVVHENTQWVYTLGDFRRIAGSFRTEEVTRFRCELSPSSGSPAGMIMECSAHANSLLLALGCSGVEDLRLRFAPGEEGRATMEIGFRSRGASGGPVHVEYHFAQQVSQPRHAAYEINQRRVERRVDVNGYRLYLKSGSKERAIRDPLESSVEDFLKKISGAPAGHPRFSTILSNIQMTHSLLSACPNSPEAQHA